MKTWVYFWSYLAQFFLEEKCFEAVEEIKTHVLCSVTFYRKSRRLWGNVEKYCRAGQATGENMKHAHWMMDSSEYRPYIVKWGQPTVYQIGS